MLVYKKSLPTKMPVIQVLGSTFTIGCFSFNFYYCMLRFVVIFHLNRVVLNFTPFCKQNYWDGENVNINKFFARSHYLHEKRLHFHFIFLPLSLLSPTDTSSPTFAYRY